MTGVGFRKAAVRLVVWLALAVRPAAPESVSPELQEALRVSGFGRFGELKRRLAAIAGWPGPVAAGADRRRLVEALTGSRLFSEAVVVARDPRSPMPSGSDA